MPESELFEKLKNSLDLIKSYKTFTEYFDSEFSKYNLKGIKRKIFYNWALDFYKFAQLDIVVTSIKYDVLRPLIDTCSVSYMGKYRTFNMIKINA